MALTFQRTLELAGILSKVQPQLQRLHLVKKSKKRHLLRNAVLVGSAVAAGAVVAGLVCHHGGDAESSSPEQSTPDAEPDSERLATDADGSRGTGASGPA